MEVGYIELFGGTGPMIDYIDFYVLSIPFINLSYRFNVLRFLFFFQLCLIFKRYTRFHIFVQVQSRASFQN